MSKSVKIGDRLVGDGHPPFIIAEACVNHQGDFEIAKRMVYFAHAMGADAIKFQMHILQDEMLPEVPMSDNFEKSLWDVIDSTNFSTEQHRQLMALCRELGIQYLCTPFSRASVDVLHSLGVAAFKTGSGELTNTPFMRHIAAYGKPTIVSTGMSLMEEIRETVDIFKAAGTPLILTHCVSAYPCPYDRVNLGMIPRLAETFGVPAGLSVPHAQRLHGARGGGAQRLRHRKALHLRSHAERSRPQIFDRRLRARRARQGLPGGLGGTRGAREIFPEEQQIVAWARESVVSLEAHSEGNADHARDGVGEAPEPGPRRHPRQGPRQGRRRGDQGGHRVRPANPLERHLMAKPRRVLVTLESRATFGYSVNVIKRAMADPALEVQTLLTGMHLMPELGNSQSMLHRAQIPDLGHGAAHAWRRAGGLAARDGTRDQRLRRSVRAARSRDRADLRRPRLKPSRLPSRRSTWGFRSRTSRRATSPAISTTPPAWRSPSSCTSTLRRAPMRSERLKRLGEQEFRIFDTGAPQLDDMVGRSFKQERITLDGKNFDLTEPYVVLIQHPVMHEHDRIVEQIEATLHACFATGLGIVWIYPNSDFGFRDILAIIERQRGHDRIVAVPNLDREDYLTILANCACLVGNSSSGLLEAPTFRIPVVNIGNRQRGRPQALNIVNASYDPSDIERAIHFVLTDDEVSRRLQPGGEPVRRRQQRRAHRRHSARHPHRRCTARQADDLLSACQLPAPATSATRRASLYTAAAGDL